MIQFQENAHTDGRMDERKDGHTDVRKDGRKDRQKDGQTLFYRTLPATAGGPTSICYNNKINNTTSTILFLINNTTIKTLEILC